MEINNKCSCGAEFHGKADMEYNGYSYYHRQEEILQETFTQWLNAHSKCCTVENMIVQACGDAERESFHEKINEFLSTSITDKGDGRY